MASIGAVSAPCTAVQTSVSRIPVPTRKKTGPNAKYTHESHTVKIKVKDKPAGSPSPSTSLTAQRSKDSSTAHGGTGGAVCCEPTGQRRKVTGVPCGTATAGKGHSVGRRTAAQGGGLFRKATCVCRTFSKPACKPGTHTTAKRATTASRQPTTTPRQRRNGMDHKPSDVQADCGMNRQPDNRQPEEPRQAHKTPTGAKLTTAIHEVAVAPPPVGGAAPGQSTLSQDIAELEDIVKKLTTTRTRSRPQAAHGVMTGTYSPGHGARRGDKEELKELVKLMATTGRRRKAGRVGQTPGRATTGTGLAMCAPNGVATSDHSEVEALMKSYLVSCQRRRKDGTQSTVSRVVPLSLKAPRSACKSSARKRTRQNYFKFPGLEFTPSHQSSPLKDLGNADKLLSPSVDVAYSPFVTDMFQRQQQRPGGEAKSRVQLPPTKDTISLYWESQNEGVFNQPQVVGAHPQVSTDRTHPLLRDDGLGLSCSRMAARTPLSMLSPNLCPSDSSDDTPSPLPPTGESRHRPIGPLVYED